jgi:hypothetical protein
MSFMLSVSNMLFMQSVVMLNVVMLSAVMLSVTAPLFLFKQMILFKNNLVLLLKFAKVTKTELIYQ